METAEEALVCQTCGAEGFTNAFIYCVKCLGYVIHRYCLAVMPDTYDEFVMWYCDDCEPPPPYHFTSPPRHRRSHSQNDEPPNALLVNTTFPKKKQKKKSLKRKLASLVTSEKDNKCISRPDRLNRCVVLGLAKPKYKSIQSQENVTTISHLITAEEAPNILLKEALVNSNSGANEITPLCAEFAKCFSMEGIARGKRDTTRVAAKSKKHRTEKSSEQSSCESSCTDAALKNDDDITHPEAGPDQDKLVSNNLSCEKELNTISKEFNGNAYASQSNYLVNDLQYIDNQLARPVNHPVWRGTFNISQTTYDMFEGFAAFLSSKACKRVNDEAITLPSMLLLEMHSKVHLWPDSFKRSMPSDESIALFFFAENAEYERGFERLVDDMIDKDLAMSTTSKNAELLIFTSRVLPPLSWRLKGKYYLWGVFKRKKNDVPVANHSDNNVLSANSGNEVTSEKETLNRVKSIESHSPQSPLCSYR